MLVLTRKKEEEIIINRNISVKVLGIENGVVKLGISAPSNVPVHRKEVQEKINSNESISLKQD
jgi:carbon storage regulator